MNPQSITNSSLRPREGSFDSQEHKNGPNEDRRQELAQMARGLRRMKRQLFLMHIEDNPTNTLVVASFRELLARSCSAQTPPGSPRARDHAEVFCMDSPTSSTVTME